jgi:acyl-CoA thioesterase-1
MFSLGLTLAVVCAAALPAVRDRSGNAAENKEAPRIVAIGDSLTSGHGIGSSRAYPAVLQRRLDSAGLNYQVVNAGVSRDTSADAVRRLDAALRGDVRVLIVALGANDGLRGVPVAQLRANLSRIIGTAQSRGISVVLCAMEALPLYGWEYTVAFHRIYRDLADQYRVPLVPCVLFNLIGNPDLMQHDHIHPNADGARVIADAIWPFVKRLVEAPHAAP